MGLGFNFRWRLVAELISFYTLAAKSMSIDWLDGRVAVLVSGQTQRYQESSYSQSAASYLTVGSS